MGANLMKDESQRQFTPFAPVFKSAGAMDQRYKSGVALHLWSKTNRPLFDAEGEEVTVSFSTTRKLYNKDLYENGSGASSRAAKLKSDDRGLSSGGSASKRQKGGGANKDYLLSAMLERPNAVWTDKMVVDDELDAYWTQGVSARSPLGFGVLFPLWF